MNKDFAMWLLGQADFAQIEGNADLQMFLLGLHTGLMFRIETETNLDLYCAKKEAISRDMALTKDQMSLQSLFNRGKYMGFVNIADVNPAMRDMVSSKEADC